MSTRADAGLPARLSLLASAVVVVLWTALLPRTADLAAQVYRVGLFQRAGWILWDNNWFDGHNLPGYSLLTPWLMFHAGIGLTGAVAAATTTVAFAAIVRPLRPDGWTWPTAWVGWASACDLLIGRVTYSVGLAFAVLAVLALTHRSVRQPRERAETDEAVGVGVGRRDVGMPRRRELRRTLVAASLAALAAAASPVAGLFLAMVVGVWWTVERRRALLAVAASGAAVTLGCALLFGDGGSQPYPAAAAAVAVVIALVLRRGLADDALLARRALLGYALVATASCLLPTPMGSNIARLGVAFAVPVALLAPRRCAPVKRRLVWLAASGWLLFAPATEIVKSIDAPETRAPYYAPLLAQLRERDTTPGRVEVVPSATRWESVYVGARYPLARGWETQIDRSRNALFYGSGLSAASYVRWLHLNAVAFVALSRAPKERWGRAEERLLRRGVAGLRLLWASRSWRLYAVARPQPLADGARVTDLGVDRVAMRFAAPTTAQLRVRWSRYWDGGPGVCIAQRPDGFMDVTVARAGPVVLRVAPLDAAEDARAC